MQYKVVPFRADVMEAEGARKAAEQLAALTKKEAHRYRGDIYCAQYYEKALEWQVW
ncbi:MAG: hypothetical protein DKINENOH_00785 [bacterium]|nr:hypothetical protein [bacterium]